VVLGEDGEGGSLSVLEVASEFNESTVGSFKVVLESGVGDLISEEVEKSEGVLVGLEMGNVEEVSGASSIESRGEVFVVSLKGVLGVVDVLDVSVDFSFEVVDGGRDVSAVLVLSVVKSLDVGDVVQKGSSGDVPVLFKFVKVGLSDVEESVQELNDGVNGVTGLDQGINVLGDKTGSLGVDLSHS